PVVEISAEIGHGVAELLDAIVYAIVSGGRAKGSRLPDSSSPQASALSPDEDHRSALSPDDTRETRIAIVGRPNVGKSSLVNRLLREERVLVSDLPGTTRDAIDVPLTWPKRRFRIVDTAGMRRPGRVGRGGKVEVVSVAGAKRSIADADVVALVVDAASGATDQDAAIGGEVDRAGRGIVIVVNKWDLV